MFTLPPLSQETEKIAADKAKLQETQAETTAKILETNKADASADEEYEIVKMKHETALNNMAEEDAAAKAADKIRADGMAKDLEDLKREKAEEEQEGKDIQAAQAKEAADLAEDQKAIQENYETNMKRLEAEATKEKEDLAAAQQKEGAALAAQGKSSRSEVEAQAAAVKSEAEANAKAEADDKAKFDKDADAAKAKAEATAAYNTAEKAKSDAAAAEDAAIKAKFEKVAADDEAAYQTAKGEADVLQDKADNAHKEYLASMQAGRDEQAAADKWESDEIKSLNGGAAQECATDGSECLLKDGACHKIDEVKGPYLGEDLVSCSAVKPAEEAFAGEQWAGIPNDVKDVEPLPPPSSKCQQMKNTLKSGKWKTAMNEYAAKHPLVTIACDTRPDIKMYEKAQAMEEVFKIAQECPKWCVPGSQTSTGVTWSTNGDCIDKSSVAMFKTQIAVLPAWKAWKASEDSTTWLPKDVNAGIATICEQAKGFLAPYLASAAKELPTGVDMSALNAAASTPPAEQ